jgi:hypothetical protein
MLGKITAALDRLRGAGDASVAIPLFDGALKPNSLLEEAPVFAVVEGMSDIALAADGESLYICAGPTLLKADLDGAVSSVAAYERPILAMACTKGCVALAFEGGLRLLRADLSERANLQTLGSEQLTCITALAFADDERTLYIARGSTKGSAFDWKRDLLTQGHTGQLLSLDIQHLSGAALASGLRWPNGIVQRPDGALLVSEAWTHCLLSITSDGRISVAYPDLPGYPARLSRAAGGGYWMSLFAKRTQLIEFVLREPEYRQKMMETIPEKYWIAPCYRSGHDFLEPLQFGAVRQMGILKPWAPSNSYGVVVRLNNELVPQFSCHSRAGGRHHGTVNAVESQGQLFVASRGSNSVLKLSLQSSQTRA